MNPRKPVRLFDIKPKGPHILLPLENALAREVAKLYAERTDNPAEREAILASLRNYDAVDHRDQTVSPEGKGVAQ